MGGVLKKVIMFEPKPADSNAYASTAYPADLSNDQAVDHFRQLQENTRKDLGTIISLLRCSISRARDIAGTVADASARMKIESQACCLEAALQYAHKKVLDL